ncbi:two component transcriptional regulator, winged helix family [Catenulispora acidiphila DSM 44928]|uniref:Two component transcriptional regulator, winged helix family n=1 Tax=Catenulispora acidiphila (strain DSM 44928 / JCM 14897 / NBRC 102108 / NRRL B-24433 / ID139908) TaxID=479433 RepID=C7QB96_CATAD|nr:response regulator transcription factor [Catenulispora acidiphila]ACU76387.1 two component transcriptional regulator, winged helix family [Catenulispora acidiphila DSM 44928]
MTSILVVEDEPTLAEAIAARLRAEGFATHLAGDGPAAVRTAQEHLPDLIVLDVMLPGFDGLEVCRRIQAERAVPVLMVTARDDESDLIEGLRTGADDYLTKPFSMRELIARVHALLRRVERAAELGAGGAPAESNVVPIGTGFGPGTAAVRAPQPLRFMAIGTSAGARVLEIDSAQRRVRVGAGRSQDEAHLTPTEFDLLACLAGQPRTVLTREKLLAEVWDWMDASGTRTVDSHVKAVRRKIGADWIRTVHGVGYALEAEPLLGDSLEAAGR